MFYTVGASVERDDDTLIPLELVDLMGLSILRVEDMVEETPADEYGDRYVMPTTAGYGLLALLDEQLPGGAE